MNKELNILTKRENLIQEYAYLEKENIRLETIINSQTKKEKNQEKKELESKLICLICKSNEKVSSNTNRHSHPICRNCMIKKGEERMLKMHQDIKDLEDGKISPQKSKEQEDEIFKLPCVCQPI